MTSTSILLSHTTPIQLLFYAIIIVSLWHIELFIQPSTLFKKWNHTIFNIRFMITALCVQIPLSILLINVSNWTYLHHWGLLHLKIVPSGTLVQIIMGFVLLDLGDYVYHVMMHKVGTFWNFHLIHHSDLKIDVSTTVREHPGETFIRVCFLILMTYIFGASLIVLIVRQLIQSFSNIAAHTSMNLSPLMEKILKYVFITPALHKVHHHYQLPYTDSNYGDVLCIWDRCFGTYKELPESQIRYGLDTFVSNNPDFIHLLKSPFNKRNHPL
ncbi:MAG: Fatty acid hydroxylase [Sphingobacteriales bacterium]|nr:Fatty acid hydroxylase [Sphingobacteriales bacterium]